MSSNTIKTRGGVGRALDLTPGDELALRPPQTTAVINLAAIAAARLDANNYVRRGKPSGNYWMDFASTKLERLRADHGSSFNLIVYGDKGSERDFYVIPFSLVAHMFTEETMVKPEKGTKRRWIAGIDKHIFRVNRAAARVDISGYRGRADLLDGVADHGDMVAGEVRGSRPFVSHLRKPRPFDRSACAWSL